MRNPFRSARKELELRYIAAFNEETLTQEKLKTELMREQLRASKLMNDTNEATGSRTRTGLPLNVN